MTAVSPVRPAAATPVAATAGNHPDPVPNERGQIGGVEAMAFGMAILVVGILLVSNAWGVVDAKTAARTAAREAARTFATAPEVSAAGAERDAVRAGEDTLREMGWANAADRVTRTHGGFVRCDLATFEAVVSVPAFRLPWLRTRLAAFRVTATDSQRVDPYRSGVPSAPGWANTASCGEGAVRP